MKFFLCIKYSILVLCIVSFTACSSKNIESPKTDNQQIDVEDNKSNSSEELTESLSLEDDSDSSSFDDFSEEDAFLDEFAEELEVEEVYDPFSGFNRAMTSFNDGLFRYVLTPVAKGYRYVVPEPVRQSIGNFFHNLLYPVRGVNNLLQGKLSNTAEETGRFVINSTIGIFGLFDPAKAWFGLEAHEEDFGQTLGYYGVGAGPHIVLPFFGPSNLRDMFSMYPDGYVNPMSVSPNDDWEKHNYHIPENYAQYVLIKAVDRINYVSLHVGEYEDLTKDAVDLYPFLRDLYEQRRQKLIEE